MITSLSLILRVFFRFKNVNVFKLLFLIESQNRPLLRFSISSIKAAGFCRPTSLAVKTSCCTSSLAFKPEDNETMSQARHLVSPSILVHIPHRISVCLALPLLVFIMILVSPDSSPYSTLTEQRQTFITLQYLFNKGCWFLLANIFSC